MITLTLSLVLLAESAAAVSIPVDQTANALPCASVSYYLSSKDAVYDRVDLVYPYYSGFGNPEQKATFTDCLDYCDQLGSSCVGVTYGPLDPQTSIQPPFYCTAAKSLQKNIYAETNPTDGVISAAKDTKVQYCAGQGTNLLTTPPSCETGNYTQASNGQVYHNVSNVQNYQGSAAGQVALTLEACLDICEILGPSKCAGVVWVPYGQSKPYCYPKTTSTVVKTNVFPDNIVAWSMMRSAPNAVPCPEFVGYNATNYITSSFSNLFYIQVVAPGQSVNGQFLTWVYHENKTNEKASLSVLSFNKGKPTGGQAGLMYINYPVMTLLQPDEYGVLPLVYPTGIKSTTTPSEMVINGYTNKIAGTVTPSWYLDTSTNALTVNDPTDKLPNLTILNCNGKFAVAKNGAKIKGCSSITLKALWYWTWEETWQD